MLPVLLFPLLLTAASAQDYCSLPTCPSPGSHTRCKFKPDSPSSKCSSSNRGLDASEQLRILDLHNSLRKQLAEGRLEGFRGATDMEIMTWDAEIAETAQIWADQCNYGHDSCRDTPEDSVGQNIAQRGVSSGFTSDLERLVTNWWDEYKLYPWRSRDGTFVFAGNTGHFTQMGWASTSRLGCGRTSYTQGKFYYEYLVCNYAPAGNIMGAQMYTAGAGSATVSCSALGLPVCLALWPIL